MTMNVQKLSPWNWFRKEELPEGRSMTAPMSVPVRRTDPFGQLHTELERVFDHFFADAGWTFPRGAGADWASGPIGSTSLLRPRLDIAESDKAYTITVEVPGVSREDVEVTVQDDALVITGEKRQEASEGNGQFHRVERVFGQFRRTLALPGDADTDNITAEFKNGLLNVHIPRQEGLQASRGRVIPIGTGKN